MITVAIRRERTRRRRALTVLPDTFELMIVGIRAGLSPTAALEMAAALAPEAIAPALRDVTHQLHRGRRLADALEVLPTTLGPHATSFTDALSTADRYGLPIEPVLDRLTTDIRTERARQAQEHARTLPVKLAFPLVMCTLPSFVLLAIVPALLGAISTLTRHAS